MTIVNFANRKKEKGGRGSGMEGRYGSNFERKKRARKREREGEGESNQA